VRALRRQGRKKLCLQIKLTASEFLHSLGEVVQLFAVEAHSPPWPFDLILGPLGLLLLPRAAIFAAVAHVGVAVALEHVVCEGLRLLERQEVDGLLEDLVDAFVAQEGREGLPRLESRGRAACEAC